MAEDRQSPTVGSDVSYVVNGPATNEGLNALFSAAWPDHACRDFQPILRHSLAYVCAYQSERLVGFVHVAWDGGIHAFLLNTTVHPKLRRRGVGSQLVSLAKEAARGRGMVWLHVDFEPQFEDFYTGCGFRHTAAGLIRLA